jgi:hypothetical protein
MYLKLNKLYGKGIIKFYLLLVLLNHKNIQHI